MTAPPTIDQSPLVPALSSTGTSKQLDWLLHTVGVSAIENTGWIRITGSDRVRWLNGMVTNSIQDLKPGQGNYSFSLNAQGQIQGDLTAFATEENALMLQMGRNHVPAMIAMFERFIIMDDVELEDISPASFGICIAGPHAADLLTQIDLPAPKPVSTNLLSITSSSWRGHSVEVIAAHSPLVSRFELWTTEAAHAPLQSALADQAAVLNGGLTTPLALEHLRILEGTPRFGIDILNKHLAQETAQTRALHFAKGCYLGQEIVERIRSRGNVHRSFTAFRLEGPLPTVGTEILAGDKPIAQLTSVAAIPLAAGTIQIGLGIARREAIDRTTTLTYTTGQGAGLALPTSVPIHDEAVR